MNKLKYKFTIACVKKYSIKANISMYDSFSFFISSARTEMTKNHLRECKSIYFKKQ